jgi:hypothetical protein
VRNSDKAANATNAVPAEDDSPAPGGANATPLTTAGEFDVDVDPEADAGRIYCICNNTGDGEMIGCDQEGCEIEWVRGYTFVLSRKKREFSMRFSSISFVLV